MRWASGICKVPFWNEVAVGKDYNQKVTGFSSHSQVYKSDKHEIGFKNNKAVLVIHNSDIDDSGKYRCEAANKIGRVETEAKLTVCSKSTCFNYKNGYERAITIIWNSKFYSVK